MLRSLWRTRESRALWGACFAPASLPLGATHRTRPRDAMTCSAASSGASMMTSSAAVRKRSEEAADLVRIACGAAAHRGHARGSRGPRRIRRQRCSGCASCCDANGCSRACSVHRATFSARSRAPRSTRTTACAGLRPRACVGLANIALTRVLQRDTMQNLAPRPRTRPRDARPRSTPCKIVSTRRV